MRSYQRVTGGRNRKVRFSEIKAKAKTGGSLEHPFELDALLALAIFLTLLAVNQVLELNPLRKTDTLKKRRKILENITKRCF